MIYFWSLSIWFKIAVFSLFCIVFVICLFPARSRGNLLQTPRVNISSVSEKKNETKMKIYILSIWIKIVMFCFCFVLFQFTYRFFPPGREEISGKFRARVSMSPVSEKSDSDKNYMIFFCPYRFWLKLGFKMVVLSLFCVFSKF